MRTLRLHHVDSDAILGVSRATDCHDDVVLLIVNLDPTQTHDATTWLDLGALGLRDDRPYEVYDELSGHTYIWRGAMNYVRLDPAVQPAHVFHVRPLP